MPKARLTQAQKAKLTAAVRAVSRNKKASAPRQRKAITRLVKSVVKGQAETKMVTFFNGSVAGTGPTQNSTGLYADKGLVSKDQLIINNNTDILKLIPDIAEGTGDNERAGRAVNPTSGTVRCKVVISPTGTGSSGWKNGWGYDVVMVAYLLQAVNFKTYRNLYVDNDFTKMLDVGDGTTVNFDGTYSAANLPVEKGYYRVLAKKRKNLRSSGGLPTGPLIPGGTTNNNSHQLCTEWTWNYGKHLPKKLLYPEQNVTVANGLNEPLNSSIFWAVAYYNTDATVTGDTNIQIEYTSILKYKDF